MKFRYDINALRAVAVISIIFFHYKVPFFDGGFSGVDIFFVISGYLMSRIIMRSMDENNFSFSKFYSKRIKRIVPALLFLILIITLISFFFYFPSDFKTNEKNAASAVCFISNILYWKNLNYFDESANTDIFIHTWSLSVEWQFYLLFPVGLYFLNKIRNKKRLLILFSFLTIIDFVFSVIFSKHYNPAAFYLLPCRAWEMMFGGIAFFLEGFTNNLKYKKYITLVGYAAILICFFWLNSKTLWPGPFTIIPVFATFLILISGINNVGVLKYKVVQFFGNISYSLYLWHWPVYVFALYLGFETSITNVILMILISVLLAFISFKYIESIKFDNLKFKWLMAGAVTIAVATFVFSHVNANSFLFKPYVLKLSTYRAEHKDEMFKGIRMDKCFITEKTGINKYDKQGCLSLIKGKKNILLIGDSHAAHLYESLQRALQNQNINVMQATVGGCYPTTTPEGSQSCQDLMNYMYNDFLIKNSNKVDGVIFTCNWINYITGKNDKDWMALNRTLNYFTQKKLNFILVGQSESYVLSYPTIVAKECQYKLNIRSNFINKSAYNANVFLRKRLSFCYVDIYNENTVPKLSPNGIPYMFDDNHFTKYGADIAVNKIITNDVGKQFFKSIANSNTLMSDD